ncbi:MAG: hypothetical protein ABI830_00815 [Pseudolabrys sp.]
MANNFRQLRRNATQLAIRLAIAATAALPIGFQRASIRTLVRLADPFLAGRLAKNMNLALGHDVPPQTLSRYFRHLGWFLSSALAVYHRGIAATPIADEVRFDESVALLDAALAEGRGAVIVSAHWSGHELVAGVVNRRHPMSLLVRQAPSNERMARKLKWYRALGADIVLRPDRASAIKDAVSYLKVLKQGKVLSITPDLLAAPGQGIEVSLFGRKAQLHGGAFALALAAGAPMMRPYFKWQSDSSLIVAWERAPTPPQTADRETAIQAAAQDWCRWFEGKLRDNPENWLFWLDKNWSRFLHETPREAGPQ